MEASHQGNLNLQQPMFSGPTPEMPRARPVEISRIFMGPSGVEMGPDEEDRNLNHFLDSLKPRGSFCVKMRNKHANNINPLSSTVADRFTVDTPALSSAELRPVSVPPEIFLNIIQYLEQPYKLRGYFPGSTDPHVFFLAIRSWKDITALQICHTTRMQAIRRYGKPSQDSVPFDPSMDSFSIEHVPWVRNMPIAGYTVRHGTPNKCCKPLGIDLLAKVQNVELQMSENGCHRDLSRWVNNYLSTSNTLRTLRVNLYWYDTCKGTSTSMARHGGLALAIFTNSELLKTLEFLELHILGTRCNNSWEPYYDLSLCAVFPTRFYRPAEAPARTS